MSHTMLDYARPPGFDTGLFVARYLQVLGWLGIVSMLTRLALRQPFTCDLTFILLFWAAAGLKRHSPTARRWVLALSWVALAVLGFILALGTVVGTAAVTVTIGPREMKNPPLWLLFGVGAAAAFVLSVPIAVLMSRRAKEQFRKHAASAAAEVTPVA